MSNIINESFWTKLIIALLGVAVGIGIGYGFSKKSPPPNSSVVYRTNTVSETRWVTNAVKLPHTITYTFHKTNEFSKTNSVTRTNYVTECIRCTLRNTQTTNK